MNLLLASRQSRYTVHFDLVCSDCVLLKRPDRGPLT